VRKVSLLCLFASACVAVSPEGEEAPPSVGESQGALIRTAKRAILACDPTPALMNECAAMEDALQLHGWIVRRPGEISDDYFPTTGVPSSFAMTDTVVAGDWKKYSFVVSAGTTLDAVMTGSGDADLYVRGGSYPTNTEWPSLTDYECRPYTSTSNESCHVAGGRMVNVWVRGYSASSQFTINVSYVNPQKTMMDIINGYVNASVHAGDQLLFYLNAHGGTGFTVLNDVSADPQFPFPANETGAYAPGPIDAQRWASMLNWKINSSAATYVGGSVQSWDVHELVKKLMGMGVKTTVVTRNCYDGAFTEMFRQEYGNSSQLCTIGTTGPYVTSLLNTANASTFLNNNVLANPQQSYSMDDFRRFIASTYESQLHPVPRRNESSGYSNGCMMTMHYRSVAQLVYNALGFDSSAAMGGASASQPSYVIARPLQFTLNMSEGPFVSNPTPNWDYHFQEGIMNWLAQTRTRLLNDVAPLAYLSQQQKDNIVVWTANFASIAASERNAWDVVDDLLRGTGGVVPLYNPSNNDLYAQLSSFSATGQTLDVFLRRMIEKRCLCGTTFAPQSALDCSGSLYGQAESGLSCSDPTAWVNQVLSFYPYLANAVNGASFSRGQTLAAMQQLTASLAPLEQNCSSTACSSQTF
jgi:hypothetical protein